MDFRDVKDIRDNKDIGVVKDISGMCVTMSILNRGMIKTMTNNFDMPLAFRNCDRLQVWHFHVCKLQLWNFSTLKLADLPYCNFGICNFSTL